MEELLPCRCRLRGIGNGRQNNGLCEAFEFSRRACINCEVHFFDLSGCIRVFRPNNRSVVLGIARPASMILQGHNGIVEDFAVSSDCSKLFSASSDYTMKVWDLASGNCIKTISLPSRRRVTGVSSHRDTVAVATWQYVCVCNWQEGKWTSRYDLTAVAFSKSGNYRASGFLDGRVEVWTAADVLTREFQPVQEHTAVVTCLHFSPNARHLASCSEDGSIFVWDVEIKQIIGMVGTGRAIQKIGFSPDGQRIVSWSGNGGLQIWNISLMQTSHEEVQDDGNVNKFALSGDGKRVLVLTDNGKVVFWNAPDGDQIFQLVSENISCIALDHWGLQAAFGEKDGTIQVRNPGKFFEAGKSWTAHQDEVTNLLFSCDGTRIVSKGKD